MVCWGLQMQTDGVLGPTGADGRCAGAHRCRRIICWGPQVQTYCVLGPTGADGQLSGGSLVQMDDVLGFTGTDGFHEDPVWMD